MSVIDAATRVRDRHSAEKVDGVLLDATTAGVIMAVAEALSPESRAKLDAMPIEHAAKVCWKMVTK